MDFIDFGSVQVRPKLQQISVAFLQAVYRDTDVPLGVRIKCAVECLPFESPKLSATAVLHPSDLPNPSNEPSCGVV